MPKINVDVNHHFKTLPRYFQSLESAVVEVVQNAYRSYWPIDATKTKPRIDVYRDGENIVVEDNGCGIQDPWHMLGPNQSRWADDVAGDQDPAGCGTFAALAYSKAVRWVSDFGELEVEGPKFFTSEEYREALQICGDHEAMFGKYSKALIRTVVTLIGATPDETTWQRIRKAVSFYQLADVYCEGVLLNGLAGVTADAILDAPGMRIHVKEGRHSSSWLYDLPGNPSCGVVWHGHVLTLPLSMIQSTSRDILGYKCDSVSMLIELLGENQVTPVLPDRRFVRNDERSRATAQAAFELAVDWLDKVMRDRVANPPTTAYEFERLLTRAGYSISGFTQYIFEHCKSAVYETLEIDNSGHRSPERTKRVFRKDKITQYDASELQIRTPTTVYDYDLRDDVIGLLVDCEGNHDVLADDNFLPGGDYLIRIFTATELPGKDEEPSYTGDYRVYIIPPELADEDDETKLTEFELKDPPSFYLNEAYLDDPTLVDDMLVIGDSTADILSAYSEVFASYMSSEVDPSDAAEIQKDFDDAVASTRARWANKKYINVNFNSLKYKLGITGDTFTVNTKTKEITFDGKTVQVDW